MRIIVRNSPLIIGAIFSPLHHREPKGARLGKAVLDGHTINDKARWIFRWLGFKIVAAMPRHNLNR